MAGSVQVRSEAYTELIKISKVLGKQPTKIIEDLIKDKRDDLIAQKKLRDDRW